MENWKPAIMAGYEVSDQGNVRSLLSGTPRPLRARPNHDGYMEVGLSPGRKFYGVHTLVLVAFVSPRPDRHQAAHLNGVRSDNRLANLAWKTPEGQHEDRLRHGTDFRAGRSSSALLTIEQARDVRAKHHVVSARELAATYSVTVWTIRNIWRGDTYVE